jgi:DNA-binding transcriptional LysR family regulator
MAEKLTRTGTALVVSEDNGLRDNLAEWLEDAGVQVMICPGPRAPRFSCVGLRREPCALLGVADVVLVDLHPEPGELVDRTSRYMLLEHYRHHGRQVLAIVDGTAVELDGINGVAVVDRMVQRDLLVGAVRQLIGNASKPNV